MKIDKDAVFLYSENARGKIKEIADVVIHIPVMDMEIIIHIFIHINILLFILCMVELS